MDDFNLICHFLLTAFGAGLIGTSGMTFSMYLLTKAKITNADMVTAIGSIFTKSRESALLVGALMHHTAGVGFAVAYTLAFSLFQMSGVVPHVLLGTAFGFAHGFVMSFILVASVAEHHPLEEFRHAGVSVALAHAFGHVVYGFLVGLTVGLSGFTVFS